MSWRALFRRRKLDHPQTERYVVSMRMTGLGDRLICLGAAWRFARNTGRTLVADWRHSPYSPDFEQNAFALCFEPLPELAGVAFIGDDRVESLRLPRPRYPAFWNDDAFLAAPYLRPSRTIFSDRDAAVKTIRAGRDLPASTVVLDACVNDGLVSLADSRTFLSALQPTPHVLEQVATFRQEYLGVGPIIGLHIRHGNGAPTGHAHYWHSFQASIDRCGRAVRVARERLGHDAPVLLCTDSSEVEGAVREQISGVITRAKVFRPPGEGELHLSPETHQGRDDAIVEMLLLAECSVLIRYPPGSFFTFYPAVMRRWETPPPPTVYDLQRPHDPEDALSPSLLM
jgi:hypothetical protein